MSDTMLAKLQEEKAALTKEWELLSKANSVEEGSAAIADACQNVQPDPLLDRKLVFLLIVFAAHFFLR
jgi:hypothetical protein